MDAGVLSSGYWLPCGMNLAAMRSSKIVSRTISTAASLPYAAVRLPGSFHPMPQEGSCVLVILGGAGDLSHKKLLPALYNLTLEGALGPKFAIIGFSMETLDDEKYRQFAQRYRGLLAPRVD
jgi:Glucose-6-phosphate dehydrogenase, NAD binding domain